jgi:hypothetical protein
MTAEKARQIAVALDSAGERARLAYGVIAAIMSSRLDGKRNAERKPPCIVRMRVEGLIGVEFKPDLVMRDGEWAIASISMTMRTEPAGAFNVRLHPDGTLRPRRSTKVLVDNFTEVARSLIDLVARGEAYFLAAHDASCCAICGRSLTDAVSRELAIGPECAQGFYHRFRIADAETSMGSEMVVEQIRAIRLQMKVAHPDLGGTGDGELFARWSGELRRLREALSKISVRKAA